MAMTAIVLISFMADACRTNFLPVFVFIDDRVGDECSAALEAYRLTANQHIAGAGVGSATRRETLDGKGAA